MKLSADYRALALDALRGRWKTAVLAGLIASLLGANIVSSSDRVISNMSQNANSDTLNRSILCGQHKKEACKW